MEAALAAARMGVSVGLVTMNPRRLALMSCNPAVGGIGKSHIVKEVDALGGLMGVATDAAGIQFRRLNLSRGPAVWSTRVQADRVAYTEDVSQFVASAPRVTLVEGLAGEIISEDGAAAGVALESGERVTSAAVVLCTGTFLGGLIHIGKKQFIGGRRGEPAAYRLSESLRRLGFEVGRLKTGTPPRLDGATIDFGRCTPQPGDDPPPWFSDRSPRRQFDQVPCYLTYTTAATKQTINESAHLSPIFSGQIHSSGPRYCPSIEDKFRRFAEKERHQIFLEPEGNGTNEIYPNGFSTALPEEVQAEAIRTVVGLEEAVITKPGYAIEYDYCPACQILPTLETKRVKRLFLAGQINGTSGYEEAAGQGIMAGINAALAVNARPRVVLDRSQAYIGVMIDDLCTRSTTEPYRMFTSRAEYRLALREDNARDRLSELAHSLGLIEPTEHEHYRQLAQTTQSVIGRLRAVSIPVADLPAWGERFQKAQVVPLAQLLKQPHISLAEGIRFIRTYDGFGGCDQVVLERAAIHIKYDGYLGKQEREIEKFRRLEAVAIPSDFPFISVNGLKKEAREKFARFRPSTLGQAGRIEGVTPGDIAVLSVHLKRSGVPIP